LGRATKTTTRTTAAAAANNNSNNNNYYNHNNNSSNINNKVKNFPQSFTSFASVAPLESPTTSPQS
jgi:hypothetical protein